MVTKSLDLGGAERLVVDMARHLRLANLEVAHVLSSADALVPELSGQGVTVHCLGASTHWDLSWVRRLRQLLGGQGFDVVHFHLPYSAALGRLAVASLPGPRRPAVAYTEHCLWDHTSAPVRWLNRLGARWDRAWVAVSAASWQSLPPRLRARCQVVHHGVDTEVLGRLGACGRERARARLRRELGLAAGSLVVVCVGNLRPQKDHATFLRAARAVLDLGVKAHFAVVGSGSCLAEAQALADRLGLGRAVSFLGARPDAVELVAGSDLFLLTSRYEGRPVALMEAMALGVPVVASAVGGVPELVEDGVSGRLVPPGRPEEAAKAAVELLGDPGLLAATGAAARRASRSFDLKVAVQSMEHLYAALAASRR